MVIPKAIRSKLHIKPGQKLAVSEADGAIVLVPIPPDPADFLCGIFKDEHSMTEELVQERERDLALE
ncbi:MAG: AbrB/MazE/SpoVT family DNA-binding domain-containing protein [Armatimonadetes bacterium]|nr:AbrB/MazE/SpoVT family DNA-binding domain-containing protein [Armatimonadota bacterium]